MISSRAKKIVLRFMDLNESEAKTYTECKNVVVHPSGISSLSGIAIGLNDNSTIPSGARNAVISRAFMLLHRLSTGKKSMTQRI